jgi:hypothetical protein
MLELVKGYAKMVQWEPLGGLGAAAEKKVVWD